MKKYDVEITIKGIPQDEYDQEILVIEDFIKCQGFDIDIDIAYDSED